MNENALEKLRRKSREKELEKKVEVFIRAQIEREKTK
jgi:hypothetical protein